MEKGDYARRVQRHELALESYQRAYNCDDLHQIDLELIRSKLKASLDAEEDKESVIIKSSYY